MSQFTLAAAGDAILTRRLSTTDDDRLDSLVERIRAADASVVNLEVLLHDYEGYPAAESGGTYMRAPPWVADELSWAGFDLFAAATNHTNDYSHGGMEATMRALERRDLPYAGLGRTLSGARAPAYADTPGGRVALVAACSTITPGSTAGEQRPDVAGRPGLSPLSLSAEYVVPPEEYDRLCDLSEALGLEAYKGRRAEQGFPVPGEDDEGLTFLNAGRGDDIQFVPGDDYRVERSPAEADRTAVLDRVRAAARQADRVVASLHSHEGEGVRRNDHGVAPFVESFARDCVDAGADAFVAHGPHVLRGMEVYEGAPVFYSLGDFAMQNETVTRLPAAIYDRYDLDTQRALPADLFDARAFDDDGERKGFLSDRAFWEAVVPVCTFGADGVERVDLHPIELGYEASCGGRGRPRLAEGETAERVLSEFADLSAPYGVDVDAEGGVGVVEP